MAACMGCCTFDIANCDLFAYSMRAAPKPDDEERRTEVEEEKSEVSGRVKDEEKKTAAAMCKKADGKGWRCKRIAQCGYSLCQYHLDNHRSYGGCSHKKNKRKKKKHNRAAPVSEKFTIASEVDRQGASREEEEKDKRRMEDRASDSFYNYSAFEPRWGKTGNRSIDGVKEESQANDDPAAMEDQ